MIFAELAPLSSSLTPLQSIQGRVLAAPLKIGYSSFRLNLVQPVCELRGRGRSSGRSGAMARRPPVS